MRVKLIALLAVLLCGAGAATAYAATRNVKVGDDYFVKAGSPRTITVKKGTKLKFKWVGKAPHNVTTQKGPMKFQSPTQTKGTFSKKLSKKGTYVLYCTIHGLNVQRLTVKVK